MDLLVDYLSVHLDYEYPLVNQHRPWQIGFGRLVSTINWSFSGSMLIYQRVKETLNPGNGWLHSPVLLRKKRVPKDSPNGGLASGKLSHNELEHHHAIDGKTHYFYGHFQ